MTEEPKFSGWVRIDDRLIHGQVTVGWWQHLRYEEIWVVDDVVRQDPFLWDALRLAAPAGVEVQVMGVAEAVSVLSGEWADRAIRRTDAVLMLLREPESVVDLVEGGVSLARVNVGNLSSRPGSRRAIKNVSLTDASVVALDALAGRGIEVFFQLSPEDVRLEWDVVRLRIKRAGG
jgi:PTS system mannose-specific IIB component